MASGSDNPRLLEKQALLRRLRVLEQRKVAQEGADATPPALPADEVLELMNQKYRAMGIADPDK